MSFKKFSVAQTEPNKGKPATPGLVSPVTGTTEKPAESTPSAKASTAKS